MCSKEGHLLGCVEAVYLAGLVPLEVLCEWVYPLTPWQSSMPFVPLLLTSAYCALGVTYAFCTLYLSLLTKQAPKRKDKSH